MDVRRRTGPESATARLIVRRIDAKAGVNALEPLAAYGIVCKNPLPVRRIGFRTMNDKPLFFLTLFLAAQSPAVADEWNWEVTPYLLGAGIDGTVSVGSIDADTSVDFEDIVNVLQGAVLLRVEATSGQNGVFGDLVYLALEEDEAKDTLGGTLEADLDSLIVEAGYRRSISEGFALDFGLRYWEFDTKLTPALLPAVRSSRDWTDGFVGARFHRSIGKQWSWVLRANVGAGGSDLALGLEMDLRREFSNGNRFLVGFRALDIDYGDTSGAVPTGLDLMVSGLTVGYTFDL
jgi:hypothetical protein